MESNIYIIFLLNCIIHSNIGFERDTDDNFNPHESESFLLNLRGKRQVPASCSGNQFKCDNNNCVRATDICDGIVHCKDGSDETEKVCSNWSCPKYTFRCAYGACVDGNARCNNITECADGSDENCDDRSTTRKPVVTSSCKDQFQCKSGECIDKYTICDGVLNCADRSDETKEVCGGDSSPCWGNGFRCAYGACVEGTARCNGTKECHDGSDESVSTCGRPTVPAPITPPPTKKPSPTPAIRVTTSTSSSRVRGGCLMPENQKGRTIQVRCSDESNDQVCNAQPGTYVPLLTFVLVSCDSKYIIDDERYEQSVCFNGVWNPIIPSCTKLCPNLVAGDLKLQCEYGGSKIDCNGIMRRNTRVFPECVYPYVKEYPVNYRYIYCENNGEWSEKPFTCIPECGIPAVATQILISDGVNATYGDSPWHIGIYDRARENQLICGGTIITTHLIISAAHCFYDESTQSMKRNSNYQIVVAKYTRDYNEKDNDIQKFYEIKYIYGHPDYIGYAGQQANDIVILETAAKMQFSALVRPACVRWEARHGSNDLISGTPGKVVGWGLDSYGRPSNYLLAAVLPYIPYKHCVRNMPDAFRNAVNPDKFCAGNETGPTVRQGDSGGGLLFPKNEVYFIYGVVSLRIAPINKSVAMFTDVYHHIEWLNDVKGAVERRLILESTLVDLKNR